MNQRPKEVAHRNGEGCYEYRGWTIHYNYECNLWFEIDDKGDCNAAADTLKQAKIDIDNYIDWKNDN